MQSEAPMAEEMEVNIPLEYFEVQFDLQLGKSGSEQKAFHRFSEARVSNVVIRLLGIVLIPIMIYVYVMALLHARSWYFIAAIGMSVVLIRNPLCLIFAYFQDQLKKGNESEFLLRMKPYMAFVGNMLSVYSCTAVGLFLIARVLNGECERIDQYHMYGCNSAIDSQSLPQEHVLFVMLLPIILSTIFKGIRMPYVVLTWFIGIACITVAIIIARAVQTIPMLVIYVPISAAVLYENHRQNIILFKVLRKQQTLLEENKVLAEAAQNELRFMIANMAHDLKTPLSSFMNGVETLSSLFTDLTRSKTAEKTKDLQKLVRENIKNLFNVNNFMTMTVNRCIDYMKASKGIKLEPRLETICLQEVLSMPLNCMRDLQSRIAIHQKAIPSSVCSHIITDLQWFQENLFCLISNAVKYSSQGHITISVSPVNGNHCYITAAKDTKNDINSPRYHYTSHSDLESLSGENYTYLDKLAAREIALSQSHSNSTGTTTILERMENGDFKKSFSERRPSLASAGRKPSCESFHMSEPTMSREREDYLLIEVEDTGIGLSDEVKESLFTPFKQAQRRAGGTGLGLYSLAKRVDALGGYYGVCNRRDGQQGSIFWFAIPYRADRSAAVSHPDKPLISFRALAAAASSANSLPTASVSSEASHAVSEDSDSGKEPTATHVAAPPSPCASPVSAKTPLRVLLVDDSLTILKMTSNLLKRHGHVVDQEENGADALTRLEKSRAEGILYDVMLIDLNMPVMDGLEATKRLREIERHLNSASGEGAPRVHQKVFAFSANSDRETMKEAMDAGADDFICKPFSIATFQEKCALLRGGAF